MWRTKQSWAGQIFQWRKNKFFLCCALDTALHGTGLAWALMGRLQQPRPRAVTGGGLEILKVLLEILNSQLYLGKKIWKKKHLAALVRKTRFASVMWDIPNARDLNNSSCLVMLISPFTLYLLLKAVSSTSKWYETCLLTGVQQLKVNAKGGFQPRLYIKVSINTFYSTDWDQGVTSCQAAVRCGWSIDCLSDYPSHFHCKHVNGAPWDSYQACRLNLFHTEFGSDECSVSLQQQCHPQKNRETTVSAIAQDSGINKTWMKWNIWRIPEASLTCRKSYFPSLSPYQTFLSIWFVRTEANTEISAFLTMTKTHSLTQHLKFQLGSLWKAATVIEGILPAVPVIASCVAKLAYRSTQTAEVWQLSSWETISTWKSCFTSGQLFPKLLFVYILI